MQEVTRTNPDTFYSRLSPRDRDLFLELRKMMDDQSHQLLEQPPDLTRAQIETLRVARTRGNGHKVAQKGGRS